MPSLAIAAGAGAEEDLLLRQARAGHAPALERLMRRHNRVLFRTARAILRDDAEAEDVVQDTYLRAFPALAAFRGDSSLGTWLTRIAANEALMRRRRRLREARVIALEGDGAEAAMDHVADQGIGPEAAALGGEMRALIEKRIDALPDLYREVFVLRAVEELSVAEAAAALGVSEAVVRTRFFRARAMLRSALERQLDLGIAEAFSFDGARCDRIVAAVLANLGGQNLRGQTPNGIC